MGRIENIDYVICRVCGKKLKQIHNSHLRTHNMTHEEYIKKFSNTETMCGNMKKQLRDKLTKYENTKEYRNKVLEGKENHVVCQVCGKKFKHIQNAHLNKRHNMTCKEYKEKFPNSETVCESMKNQIRNALIGYKHTEETRRKMSESGKGRVFTEEHCRNMSKAFKQNYKDGIRKVSMKGAEALVAYTKEHGTYWKGKSGDPELIKAHKKGVETRKRNGSYKEMGKRHSKKIKEYKDSLTEEERLEYCKAKLEQLKGSWKAPNKLEQRIINLNIDNLDYTGDRIVWVPLKTPLIKNGKEICNKNPDFILNPINKTQCVVEIFGDYFHDKQEERDLLEKYKEVGINCLIIWEHEVYKNIKKVKTKILDFIKLNIGENNERIHNQKIA